MNEPDAIELFRFVFTVLRKRRAKKEINLQRQPVSSDSLDWERKQLEQSKVVPSFHGDISSTQRTLPEFPLCYYTYQYVSQRWSMMIQLYLCTYLVGIRSAKGAIHRQQRHRKKEHENMKVSAWLDDMGPTTHEWPVDIYGGMVRLLQAKLDTHKQNLLLLLQNWGILVKL